MHVDTPQSRCRAGVARGDITPPVGIYHRMWGAAMHDRATGIHRPLLTTLLWLEPRRGDAAEARLIVTLDHCLLDRSEMANIRQATAGTTGIRPDNVHVALSHTHGAGLMTHSRSDLPGGDIIGPYLDEMAQKVGRLAVVAQGCVEPATIVYGFGRCSLAAHRDLFDEQRGHYVCGFNPAGPADDTLIVARIAGDDGSARATVVNYACHPTTLAWDNTAISPDWVGAMREMIEAATGAPCLFLQGASGDLGPREGFVGDHEIADRNGRQAAYAALATLESLPHAGTRFEYAGPVLSGTWIGTWKHAVLDDADRTSHEAWRWERFVTELPYRDDLPTREETLAKREKGLRDEETARAACDMARVRDCRASVEQMTRQLARLESLPSGSAYPQPVTIARLGDAIWVFVPGELYQIFQTRLRQRFAPRPVIVSTVTDDWQPGYLPQASSYGKGIYQDVIACVAPGSLEMLMEVTSNRIGALLSASGEC